MTGKKKELYIRKISPALYALSFADLRVVKLFIKSAKGDVKFETEKCKFFPQAIGTKISCFVLNNEMKRQILS